jgi:DNA mismatch repair protein MutH
MLENTYKFWETNEDKQERLRKIWLDLKKKNALGGVDARTTEE